MASGEHSDKIYFYKPDKPPRIIAIGLDYGKIHPVKIFYNNKLVQTLNIDFIKLKTRMVYIWGAKGSWHMESGKTGQCNWPLE